MKKMIILLGCVWGMMLSCSKDPQDTNSKQSGNNVHEWEDSTLSGDAVMGEKMIFKVGGGMSVERNEGTRASTDVNGIAKFTVNDLVTIGVTRGATDETKNYKVTATSQTSAAPEVWTSSLAYNGSTSDAFFWKSTGESVTIRAWSYGDGSTTSVDPDNNIYQLETDQQANGYKELMYSKAATYSYGEYSSGIPIQFYHQMTRLVISLTHIKPGDLDISEIYIGDGSETTIPTTAKFQKPTSGNIGTWKNFGEEKGQITPKTEVANSRYSAVLIPTTYEVTDKKFVVIKTSDGRTYCYIPNQNLTLVAGTQYNYTISVKDLKEVSTLTIGDIADYTYDGTAKTPTPTIKDGTKTLVKDTDYELSYSNNINAGTATVTVTGKGGYYSGSQSKNFTINRAIGSITQLSSTSLSQTDTSPTGTITVTRPGDGEITATSSNTNIATVSVNNNVVTVTSVNDGSVTITIKVNQGTNYTAYTASDKTVTVSSSGFRKIKMNPLWYVARYNMKSATESASSLDDGTQYNWANAMSNFAAQTTSYSTYTNANKTVGSIKYHLPVRGELYSIAPASGENYGLFTFDDGSGTYKATNETVIFGYNSSTKNGISEAAYWKKISNTEIHAIRFLGTYYCSAWKYELIGFANASSTNHAYLRVSATLIGRIPNSESAAKSWYNANWNSVEWADNEANFAQQRTFYALGYSSGAMLGKKGYHWSATQYSGEKAWNLTFSDGMISIDYSDDKGGSFNVRLFRDN